jgi:hypothetical protein
MASIWRVISPFSSMNGWDPDPMLAPLQFEVSPIIGVEEKAILIHIHIHNI